MIRKLINFILYSNIFIALCAVALAFTNELVVDGQVRFDSSCLFIFFSTLFTYTYLKVSSSPGTQYQTTHRDWAADHKQLSRNILAISLLATAGLFLKLNSDVKFTIIIVGIVTGLYGFVPIPFTNPKMKLRDLGMLKTVFVAVVWSVTTVIVPLADSAVTGDMMAFLLLRRFLFILALTIAFEIKELPGDLATHLKTLPTAIGIRGTKMLAQGFLVVMMVINTLQYFFFFLPFSNMIAFNLSLLVSVICIQPLNEETSEDWYYLVLDGMMVLQFVFVYVAARFF